MPVQPCDRIGGEGRQVPHEGRAAAPSGAVRLELFAHEIDTRHEPRVDTTRRSARASRRNPGACRLAVRRSGTLSAGRWSYKVGAHRRAVRSSRGCGLRVVGDASASRYRIGQSLRDAQDCPSSGLDESGLSGLVRMGVSAGAIRVTGVRLKCAEFPHLTRVPAVSCPRLGRVRLTSSRRDTRGPECAPSVRGIQGSIRPRACLAVGVRSTGQTLAPPLTPYTPRSNFRRFQRGFPIPSIAAMASRWLSIAAMLRAGIGAPRLRHPV